MSLLQEMCQDRTTDTRYSRIALNQGTSMNCPNLVFQRPEGCGRTNTNGFERMETVFRLSNCLLEIRSVLSTLYSFGQIKKLEDELVDFESKRLKGYLSVVCPDMIHGSVWRQTKNMQEDTEMASELMDMKISNFC
ncbi:hypothetical protein Tco_0186388 [Tanacetum coccineum]